MKTKISQARVLARVKKLWLGVLAPILLEKNLICYRKGLHLKWITRAYLFVTSQEANPKISLVSIAIGSSHFRS